MVAMDIVFTSMGSNLSTIKKNRSNVMSFYDDPIILPPSPCSGDADVSLAFELWCMALISC